MNLTLSSSARRPRRARRIAVVAGVAAVALLLSACSGSGGSAAATKKLTFWLSLSAAQEKGFTELTKEYTKETGVSFDITNVPYTGYQTKLHDAAQANALPDVASIGGPDPLYKNKLVDLSSIVDTKSDHINSDYISKSSSGQVLTIPTDVTASGLFINKSLFEKAGVKFPTSPSTTWTWKQFIAAADKVRKATGAKYDLTFDASPSRLRAMVYELGGKYMHSATTTGKISADAATQKAVKYFVGLNNDTIMPKSVWTSGADPSALFQSGQVVAYWSGVWQVSAFATSITKFDWASVPSPAQPTQASDVNYGGAMAAFNNSASESKAAKAFIAWLYKPAQYKKLTEINGYLPVETGLDVKYDFTSQAAQSAFQLYNKELPGFDPISTWYANTSQQWALSGKTLTTDISATEIGKAINGQESSKQAVDNIVDSYNQQLGR